MGRNYLNSNTVSSINLTRKDPAERRKINLAGFSLSIILFM